MTAVDLSLRRIEQRLAAHRPRQLEGERRCAVAALLRFDAGAAEVLLMKRVERSGDRWSGHISMPGGAEEAGDPDLLATAVRETREELGIDLGAIARPLGQLDPVHAIARGQVLAMTITPFVFAQERPAELALGPEAERALWLPLDRVARGELDAVFEYRGEGGKVLAELGSWRWQGDVIWGLTYQMLSGLLVVVR